MAASLNGLSNRPLRWVLELAVDLVADCEHLPHVAPVYTDLVDRAINGVLDKAPFCPDYIIATCGYDFREGQAPGSA